MGEEERIIRYDIQGFLVWRFGVCLGNFAFDSWEGGLFSRSLGGHGKYRYETDRTRSEKPQRDGPQARWQMVHPDEINTYLVPRFSQISHNGTYLADTSRIY